MENNLEMETKLCNFCDFDPASWLQVKGNLSNRCAKWLVSSDRCSYITTLTDSWMHMQTGVHFKAAEQTHNFGLFNTKKHSNKTLQRQGNLRSSSNTSHKPPLPCFTCSSRIVQVFLCELCPHRCTYFWDDVWESACMCSSPPLACLSGSTIWGDAKVLVKQAAGHHSWLANANTHRHMQRKTWSHQVTSASPPPRASTQCSHLHPHYIL